MHSWLDCEIMEALSCKWSTVGTSPHVMCPICGDGRAGRHRELCLILATHSTNTLRRNKDPLIPVNPL